LVKPGAVGGQPNRCTYLWRSTSADERLPKVKARQTLRAIGIGALYCGIGVLFGAFSANAASNDIRIGWRLAAWVVSLVVFAAHIVWAQREPSISTTKAAAVAIGSLGLAAAANVHAYQVGETTHARGLAIALIAWPVITAIPAFFVALTLCYVWRRLARRN
jgi:hypothetical protein